MYKRLKKDTKWSILNLGSFDIQNIKKELLSYSDEWLIDETRQQKGLTHSSTKMYRVCETDYAWAPGTPIETNYINSLKSKKAIDELNHIFNVLEDYYSGKIIRCEFIKLLGNSKVLRHTDGGALLHYSRRVHIPLVTNAEIMFTVQHTTINMEESQWYEINNQLPHEVENPTDLERIHLIIDILPDEMLYLGKEKRSI